MWILWSMIGGRKDHNPGDTHKLIRAGPIVVGLEGLGLALTGGSDAHRCR